VQQREIVDAGALTFRGVALLLLSPASRPLYRRRPPRAWCTAQSWPTRMVRIIAEDSVEHRVLKLQEYKAQASGRAGKGAGAGTSGAAAAAAAAALGASAGAGAGGSGAQQAGAGGGSAAHGGAQEEEGGGEGAVQEMDAGVLMRFFDDM
jgi:hypothetical protein